MVDAQEHPTATGRSDFGAQGQTATTGQSTHGSCRAQLSLLGKSAKFYGVPLDKSVHVSHWFKIAKIESKTAWWSTSVRNRRIIALALLLLFTWVIYRMLSWVFRAPIGQAPGE